MGDVLQFIIGLLTGIIPPIIPEYPRLTAYLRSVALMMTVQVALIIFIVTLMFGWVPGTEGVAWRINVEQRETDISAQLRQFQDNTKNREDQQDMTAKSIQLLIIRANLRTTMYDLCSAARTNNQPALTDANTQLGALRDQFRDIAGYSWDIPDCKTILVDRKGL